jgi:hypothetical protein
MEFPGYIKNMKEVFSDENSCREKNHHCDPESFNDSIGDLEINNKTDSLTPTQFAIDFFINSFKVELKGYSMRKAAAANGRNSGSK